jgi:single-stranded DNA-binding protein
LGYASLLTSLDSKPTTIVIGGQEFLQAPSTTTGDQQLKAQLLVKATSSCAGNFATQEAGALLIVSGGLSLDDEGNLPVINVASSCIAHPDQFINEVAVTGRLSGTCKEAEKSLSSSIAVNRRRASGDEEPDWFRIRCFGLNKEKLSEAPKGALVSAYGILEQRTSAKGEPFVEVKCRNLVMHARAKGHDHAEGTTAKGYAQSDFDGDATPSLPSSWT